MRLAPLFGPERKEWSSTKGAASVDGALSINAKYGEMQKAQSEDWAFCMNLARPEGFEPPTPWFVARYSIQMSYGRNLETFRASCRKA